MPLFRIAVPYTRALILIEIHVANSSERSDAGPVYIGSSDLDFQSVTAEGEEAKVR